nr:DNA integrity scanning protein DisA nucleotide-binding domain protein [Desulforhopalus vacuolatus]
MTRVRFLSRFAGPDLPQLGNYKHVRKLLQSVEKSGNSLISDGTSILGVAHPPSDCFDLSAEYLGRQGFLSVAGELICSFRDGRYSSSTFKAKLFEVEEALLDFNFSSDQNHDIFCIVAALVREAEDCAFGCSIVVDLAPEPEILAGQSLETPIDLRDPKNLDLAIALAKVDGALHIKADLKLYGFACLLDGLRVPEEDRARGARYNSALRFTAHHPESIIIVVSSDTAVSVFLQGRVLYKNFPCELYADCQIAGIPLSSWLKSE